MSQLSTQPYKGTRDFYPTDMRFREWMFGKVRQTVKGYGYLEYEGPMLEPFELYAAKTGEEIVNQQLYWMMDRGERKIAVRPEMTPTLARMVAAKLHELPRPIRLYSIPNLWRYERPQKGRLREFWQPNVDVLGGDPTLADAEILSVAYDLIESFGGGKFISIKVNNRKFMNETLSAMGFNDSAQAMKIIKLIDARGKLPPEKFVEEMSKLNVDAGQLSKLEEFMSRTVSASHFKNDLVNYAQGEGYQALVTLFEALPAQLAEKTVVFDPAIVRGLDYYTGTVFEIYDTSGENPRAIFGGGRYDNLIGMFGGKDQLSGVGFGMGDVGLQNFLETHQLVPAFDSFVDVFMTLPKKELTTVAGEIAADLRRAGFSVMSPLQESGFGNQLKQASRHQCRFTVLLGDDELSRGSVMIKNMATGEQAEVKKGDVSQWIKSQQKK